MVKSGIVYAPDLVAWRGDLYVVKTVEDLTNWGPGFVEAECISVDLAEAPPGTLLTPSPRSIG